MKKILGSVGVLALVGTLVLGATGAFFSDTETSTGNTFTAGAIDLGIDNHSYYNGKLNPETTWRIDYDMSDEGGGHQFFNFQDLKPGDWGEDTISLHVKDNDSYLCADVTLTSNNDNGLTEPEGDDGDTTAGPTGQGELADAVNFYWWADDGDNVFETCEGDQGSDCKDETLLSSGPLGTLDVDQTATVALADSQTNIWGDVPTPLPGDSVRYIAKAWCFGNTEMEPYDQDGGNQQNGPDNRPVICNGADVNNVTQTDSMTADISFRAVQSRNNAGFVCSTPTGHTNTTVVVGDGDLETVLANSATSGKWYFYDDTIDVLNNSLGGFTAGPATPPLGTGSAVANPLASASGRTLLTNGGFGGTLLSNISALSYSYFQPVPGTWSTSEAPFLRFNVDFSGSALYQKSLVYVPIANGPVVQGSWQSTGNMAAPGALWVYSGTTWPVGVGEPGTTLGTTAKTWTTILANYPAVRMHPLFPQIGMRVGEPGPAGLTANLDNFSITISGNTQTFNFEN